MQLNIPLIVCLFVVGIFLDGLSYADNDDDKKVSKIQHLAGQTIIFLDSDAQQSSGIETITLKPASRQLEFTTYGKAISLQPLLQLHNRYLLTLTERSRATAKFNQAEQSINRQRDLYQNGVASKRLLQEQQAQWQADKAQLDAAHFQDQSIVDEAVLNWGKTLTGWALSIDSSKLNAFLSGQETLLQVTLPANKQLTDDTKVIYIEPSGIRNKAHKAELIAVAPQADSGAQGTSYFFRTSGRNIRAGMNITAWIPEQSQSITGIIIPKSALIWSMDQALVYIKIDDEKFIRRTVTDYSATTDGYFITNTLKSGEQIVTMGGQMLLSEELRSQIPDEDN